MNTISILAIHILAYWATYFICDYNFDSVSRKQVVSVLPVVLFNQLIVSPLAWYVLSPLREYIGIVEKFTVYTLVYQILFVLLLTEVIFYTVHYWLHSKLLYSKIHRIHHKWTSPIGAAAFYCHPIEHFCANVATGVIPAIVVGASDTFILVWTTLATINSVKSHSKYLSNSNGNIPGVYSKIDSKYHKLHHSKFTCNYGILGILDIVFGTSINCDINAN